MECDDLKVNRITSIKDNTSFKLSLMLLAAIGKRKEHTSWNVYTPLFPNFNTNTCVLSPMICTTRRERWSLLYVRQGRGWWQEDCLNGILLPKQTSIDHRIKTWLDSRILSSEHAIPCSASNSFRRELTSYTANSNPYMCWYILRF